MKNFKFKKRISKIEFLKVLLTRSNLHKCEFCKYSWTNYKYPVSEKNYMMSDIVIMKHFKMKCKTCINNKHFINLKKERKKELYWYIDEFKPLYEWEGDKND